MPMFKKLAEGYLSTAGQFLTKSEKAHIAFSGKLITFEIGVRFLTDFLSGDTSSAFTDRPTTWTVAGLSLNWWTPSSGRRRRCRHTWTGDEPPGRG